MLMNQGHRERKINLEMLKQHREKYKKVEKVQLNCILPSFKPYAESWPVYHFKKGEKHKWQIN